ncbi:hypothetical protein [Streptomyces sp. NEAU-YJ-81]|uniref:hypothetical protein n=1 Tax=Streptomyces sp. NEAU-YJ-81 TaxID=2820288 RepID=UPI001ABC38B5|nr:hypothetical protein [Streptomyces sp. NEAU-YJ-81]MBO3681819.1 hypothetical protein [Streptomyces sp. NEAU-YJ-81]
MATRSFTEQCERIFGPEPSLAPLFVEGLETGQRGGSDPEDVFATTLRESSPDLVDSILDGWKKTSRVDQAGRATSRSRGVRDRTKERGYSWEERVRNRAAEYSAYHDAIARLKRHLIKAEVSRALDVGVSNWTPSDEVKANKSLLYEATQAVWGELTIGPRCGQVLAVGETPARPRYALRLSRIKCNDKDEIGHDEVYVVSVVVDGAGNLRAETSPRYRMNDGDTDVKWPNRYMYPGADPGGFLDLAVELWEDDGGYGEVVKAIAGLGAAVAAAGAATTNPYVLGAGVALGLISGLVGIAGLFRHDVRYGREERSWLSDADLAAGVGPYTVSFINRDTGWRDFTQWNYDLQIDLVLTSGQ